MAVAPPTIVLFVNDPELLHFSYKRFLENSLREAFGFEGTTLRILAREKNTIDRGISSVMSISSYCKERRYYLSIY